MTRRRGKALSMTVAMVISVLSTIFLMLTSESGPIISSVHSGFCTHVAAWMR